MLLEGLRARHPTCRKPVGEWRYANCAGMSGARDSWFAVGGSSSTRRCGAGIASPFRSLVTAC